MRPPLHRGRRPSPSDRSPAMLSPASAAGSSPNRRAKPLDAQHRRFEALMAGRPRECAPVLHRAVHEIRRNVRRRLSTKSHRAGRVCQSPELWSNSRVLESRFRLLSVRCEGPHPAAPKTPHMPGRPRRAGTRSCRGVSAYRARSGPGHKRTRWLRQPPNPESVPRPESSPIFVRPAAGKG